MFEGKRIAVFDAEIKKPIEKCSRGWQSHDEMGVSVLVIFDYRTMRYRVFDDTNIAEALYILNTYDWIVGFNTVGFDWKLILATYGEVKVNFNKPAPEGDNLLTLKTTSRPSRDFDILREIWISLGLDPDHFKGATHGGYKLDDVAFDTIGMRKTANGALAPLMYQEGKLADVIDYCIEDVRIEKTLFEFIAQYGYCVRNGKIVEVEFTGYRVGRI